MKHREIEDGNMGKNMFRSETMKEGLTMLGEEFGGAKNPREGRQCELRREKERIRVTI